MNTSKLFYAMFFSCITGCIPTTVNLTAKNTLKDSPVNVVTAIKDKSGNTKSEISIGLIQAKQEINQKFEIDNDGQFETIANLPGSAIIFKETRSVVGKRFPDVEIVDIINSSTWVDDTTSLTTLSDSFKRLGDDIGAIPSDLKSALTTVFGAIIVAIPNANDKPGQMLYTVTPEEVGVRIETLDDLPTYQTEEKRSTTISGSGAIQAGANIGPYAAFGGSFNSDNLYTLSWDIRGFGMVQKREDPNRPASIQIKRLPRETKQSLVNALQSNPAAKLYYINKMYIIKSADMAIKTHKKLDTKADFNAVNIVSGSSVFSNEITNEESKHYADVVLNYFGNILSSNILLEDITEGNVNNLTLKTSPVSKEISPEIIDNMKK